MIQAVIFDCFGVIVGQGFEHTYRIAGGDPARDTQFIQDMLGKANLGLISEDDFHEEIANKLHISRSEWRGAMETAEQPDEQLLSYIEGLRTQYKTAILSNANKGVLASRIGAERLQQCFDEVIASAEVGMTKPNPAIYELAATRLGVEPQVCVFFDDNEYMLEPARQLGMQAFLYTSLDQAKSEIAALA